jgi:hypothetical protein
VIIAGTVLLVSLLVIGLFLASAVPTIHDPPSADDPAVIAVAETFEQNFASELTRVRPDQEPWGVRVREEDLNAWLWTRLGPWIAHAHGTSAFGSEPMLQAHVSVDRVVLSTESVTVAFDPRVVDQELQIRSTSGTALGRLPLPGFMFDLLIDSVPLSALGDSLFDGDGSEQGELSRKPYGWVLANRFELHDGRWIELLEIQLDEDEAVLVFRTLLPDSNQP